jgi:hypothetical protein
MRLIGRSAVSAWLALGLVASAALGLGISVALALIALATPTFARLTYHVPSEVAAAGSPPAHTVASVVPAAVTPGSQVTFAVSCASADSASATFYGQPLGLARQVAMDAGTGNGDFTVTVTLPQDIRPAVYHPYVTCADGTSTTAALTVTEFPVATVVRTGHPATSTSGIATAGLVLIGVGVVAGGIAMRRRASARARTGSLPPGPGPLRAPLADLAGERTVIASEMIIYAGSRLSRGFIPSRRTVVSCP